MNIFETFEVYDYSPERLQKGYFVHLKRDGYAVAAMRFKDGMFYAHTRTPRQVVSSQEWYQQIEANLPKNSLILGELFFPGGKSSDVRSVLANNKVGKFECFAVQYWDGEPVKTWEEVYSLLSGKIELVETVFDITRIPPGYEGYVFKNSQWPKNPYDWMKWKPERTIDLRVEGFIAGEGNFLGGLGALILSSDDGKIKARTSSGFTMKERFEIWKNKEFWLGKVVEIAYTEKQTASTLRHSRFIRMRDDKDRTTSG